VRVNRHTMSNQSGATSARPHLQTSPQTFRKDESTLAPRAGTPPPRAVSRPPPLPPPPAGSLRPVDGPAPSASSPRPAVGACAPSLKRFCSSNLNAEQVWAACRQLGSWAGGFRIPGFRSIWIGIPRDSGFRASRAQTSARDSIAAVVRLCCGVRARGRPGKILGVFCEFSAKRKLFSLLGYAFSFGGGIPTNVGFGRDSA